MDLGTSCKHADRRLRCQPQWFNSLVRGRLPLMFDIISFSSPGPGHQSSMVNFFYLISTSCSLDKSSPLSAFYGKISLSSALTSVDIFLSVT